MTSMQRFCWGLGLKICGAFLVAGGLALTFTLFGAVIGIPMVLIGMPVLVWGVVWMVQSHSQQRQEAISAGVRDGIRELRSSDAATDSEATVVRFRSEDPAATESRQLDSSAAESTPPLAESTVGVSLLGEMPTGDDAR